MQQMPPSLTKSKALKELKDKKKPTPPKKPTKAAQVFVWEGVDRKGVKVSGEMMGIDANLIKANLRRQGVNPQKIRKKSTPLFSKNRRIKPMDIALFTRQMATMLKAGVPLVQACDIIAGGFENPRMITLLGEIKQDRKSVV